MARKVSSLRLQRTDMVSPSWNLYLIFLLDFTDFIERLLQRRRSRPNKSRSIWNFICSLLLHQNVLRRNAYKQRNFRFVLLFVSHASLICFFEIISEPYSFWNRPSSAFVYALGAARVTGSLTPSVVHRSLIPYFARTCPWSMLRKSYDFNALYSTGSWQESPLSVL